MTDLPFLAAAWVGLLSALIVGFIMGWMAFSLYESRIFRHFDANPDRELEIG